MNPIKSHERSCGIFYDEEIKFFSPVIAHHPDPSSLLSNDSFVLAFPGQDLSPTNVITFSHWRASSLCISPLITDLITLVISRRSSECIGFHGGKLTENRVPRGNQANGRWARSFNLSSKVTRMSVKNIVRGGLVERGRRGAKSVAESHLIQ